MLNILRISSADLPFFNCGRMYARAGWGAGKKKRNLEKIIGPSTDQYNYTHVNMPRNSGNNNRGSRPCVMQPYNERIYIHVREYYILSP